jgi:hypothetical protein
VCFRNGYRLCFDLTFDSKAERWRINSTTIMVEKTPNCDVEVSVVSILTFYDSF